MKKVLLFIGMTIFTFSMNAQTVNGLELEDIPARYVEIVSQAKMFKAFQVTVYLDYGQIGTMKDISKGHIINKETGKLESFNGAIGALNYLEKRGFRYKSEYFLSAGNSNILHILLENTNYDKSK
ncbi:hypothetical protein N8719_02230 [Flavobacteriaceae bacterium]|nr:hypothetical protein [Flavobacteriaceae bacterium]